MSKRTTRLATIGLAALSLSLAAPLSAQAATCDDGPIMLLCSPVSDDITPAPEVNPWPEHISDDECMLENAAQHRAFCGPVSDDTGLVAPPAPLPLPSPTFVPQPQITNTPDLGIRTASDYASVVSGESVTVDVLANDTSLDGKDLTLTKVSSSDGSAQIAQGKVFFESPDDVVHERQVVLTYTVSDGTSTAEGQVRINIVPRLIVLDDTASVSAGETVLIDVLANDQFNEGHIEGLVVPLSGAVKIVGDKISYTAEADFTGPDQFAYSVVDKYGQRGQAQVVVQVASKGTPSATPTHTTPTTPVSTPTHTASVVPVTSTSAPVVSATTTKTSGATTSSSHSSTSNAAGAKELAYTGFDPVLGLLAGAGLVLVGGSVVATTRSRSVRKH